MNIMKLTQITFSQKGRSMTEMLGVLVIMGILSIGGIMGYQYALDYYRVSATIDDINLRRIALMSQTFSNYSLSEFPFRLTVGYTMEAPQSYAGGFILTVHGMPQSVCQKVYEHFFTQAESIILYKDAQTIPVCQDNATVKLFFNHFGGVTRYMCGDKYCEEHQQCYQGQCVDAVCTPTYGCDDEETPFCRVFADPSLNECTVLCQTPTTSFGNCPCNTDKDCLDAYGNPKTGDARYCNFGRQKCVSCISDEQCADNQICNMDGCIPIKCQTDHIMNERACATCQDFLWNGHACCPTENNTSYSYAALPSEECVSCGGIIQGDICVPQECSSDLSLYTDLSSCQRCGGLWDLNNAQCIERECSINSDCPKGYYCGAQTHSNCFPAYNKCYKLNVREFSIVHNNQKEVWYYPENAYNYWSLSRACEALGKRIPSIDELRERWRELYANIRIPWLPSSTPSGSCGVFSIHQNGGISGTYHNTSGICY